MRDLLPTRWSLVSRLKNLEDQVSWQEFFDTYWQLIYGVAMKAGLNDLEAQDVVQDTIIGISKRIKDFQTDPGRGSFKGWLLTLTRWKIGEQFKRRKRQGGWKADYEDSGGRETDPVERLPDPRANELDRIWNEEWAMNLIQMALERIKIKAKPKHFQIFQLLVVEQMTPFEVAKAMDVNIGTVYLVKHRLNGAFQRELARLDGDLT